MRIFTTLVLAAFVAAGSGCTRSNKTPAGQNAPAAQRTPTVSVAGGDEATEAPQRAQPPSVALAARPDAAAWATSAVDDRSFGAPTEIANRAVYPVTSRTQVDVGPLLALDAALEAGAAEVREREGGGSVNQLIIENKGKVPLFVLAGTVVKGGNQDRQIGQDFIIEGQKTTPVDAFCVEHGRWNGQRNGQATNAQFKASDAVATSKVRAAGQYKKSQSEVWSNVSSTNAAHNKAPASDTLLATIDDAEIARERTAIAAQVDGALARVNPQGDLVGIAYAIDGRVRGARWFSHNKVFELARKKIIAGIALDAVTARAEARAAGRPLSTTPAPPASAVDAFVKAVEAAAVAEKRNTAGGNVNEYQESGQGYGSRTMMKGGSTSPGKPTKPVSVDVLSK